MTYLFCTLFLQVLALRQFLSIALTGTSQSSERGMRGAHLFASLGIILAAGLMSAPIIIEVVQAMSLASGREVPLGGDFRPLWFMGAAALTILATFGYRIARRVREKSSPFLAIGANTFGVLIGLYMVFVVGDQLYFYALHRQDAGVVNWSMMNTDPSLREIHCESDILLVRGIDSGTATYRCPNAIQLVYGRYSGTPVVPWPGFLEGTSQPLAVALKKMQKDAVSVQANRD